MYKRTALVCQRHKRRVESLLLGIVPCGSTVSSIPSLTERGQGRGRDASYPAPPAQIRT